MKICPKCNRTYEDTDLNYCLTDGTQLTTVESEPTVVIPRKKEKNPGRLMLWIGLAALATGALLVVIAVLLVFRFYPSDDTNTANRQAAVNRQTYTSPTPRLSTPPAASPIPYDDNLKGAEPESSELPDEVTPIQWETSASGFKGKPGETYRFRCPPNGKPGILFGSDIYADYSSICTAAVHMGVITFDSGGDFTLQYRPGRPIYGSTDRNDIKSSTASEHSRSFVIRQ